VAGAVAQELGGHACRRDGPGASPGMTFMAQELGGHACRAGASSPGMTFMAQELGVALPRGRVVAREITTAAHQPWESGLVNMTFNVYGC